MKKPLFATMLLICLSIASCAGLDIEGENIPPHAVRVFRDFKNGLSEKVCSARVQLTGRRVFMIHGDTDRLDRILEALGYSTLLLATETVEFKKPEVAIFLLYPNDEVYASVSLFLDPDELRRPEVLIHYGGWHFRVRAGDITAIGRRWLDMSY
jgi:hypothetical protein